MFLDFDDIRTWAPQLTYALGDQIDKTVLDELSEVEPVFVEDAHDRLLALTNRETIIDATLVWVL